MSMFEVRGRFKVGLLKDKWQPFIKIVESQNEKNAGNTVYSLMGSEHGLKRNMIRIDEVKAVDQPL
jgi:large subunit ribosomal protein LX